MLCVFQYAAAQGVERQKANLPVITEPVTVLEKATGWVLQDNGVWLKGSNYIPNSNAEMNRSGDPEVKLGKHNFEKMELREVMIQGEQYMVLLIFTEGGKFEFETLRQEWKSSDDVHYYVFKATMLKELMPDTIKPNITRVINLDVFCADKIIDYDKNTYIQKVANHILKNSASGLKNKTTLLMPIQLSGGQGAKVVRFRFIEIYNKRSIFNRYFDPDALPVLLSKYYYEVSYGDFILFTRTVPIYEDLIANPKTFLDFFKRGIAKFHRMEYQQAIYDFEKAIESAPLEKTFLIYAYMGSCYHELEDYFNALNSFDKAVENKPQGNEFIADWAKAVYNRGITRYQTRDNKGACADWNQAAIYGVAEADKLVKRHCRKY
jgi:tetratricopeptide (TPR) repeat protein